MSNAPRLTGVLAWGFFLAAALAHTALSWELLSPDSTLVPLVLQKWAVRACVPDFEATLVAFGLAFATVVASTWLLLEGFRTRTRLIARALRAAGLWLALTGLYIACVVWQLGLPLIAWQRLTQ